MNECDEHGGSRDSEGACNWNDGRAYIVFFAIFSTQQLHQLHNFQFNQENSAFFLVFCSQVRCHRIASTRATQRSTRHCQKAEKKSFKSESLCARPWSHRYRRHLYLLLFFSSRANLAYDVRISGDSQHPEQNKNLKLKEKNAKKKILWPTERRTI